MQIIGKVNQPVIYPTGKKTSNRKFYFKNQILNRKSFRIYNEQNLIYKWSLYEIKDDQTQNYLDSIQFTLDKSWQKYSKWYQNVSVDISSELKDRDNQKIAQKWKEIIINAENKQFKATVYLQKRKISIQYKLQIKNQYDNILEQYQKEKQRKLREKQQRMYMRSTLMPNRLLSDPNQLKSHGHDQLSKSQYGMLRTDSNQFHKEIHSHSSSIGKKSSGQRQKVRFNTSQNINLEPSSTSLSKSPSKTKLQNKTSHQSSEMLKNQSKILSQIKQDNQNHSVNNSNKRSNKKSSSNKTTPIQIKHQTLEQQPVDYEIPLIKVDSNPQKVEQVELPREQSRKNLAKDNFTRKVGKGQLKSEQAQEIVGSKATWPIKQIISYLLLSVIMVWMVYQLMKPTSRV